MGVTLIFGLPRVGKTALMTGFGLSDMTGKNARLNLKAAAKIVNPLKASGLTATLPLNHLVYADYTITTKSGITNYDINGFNIGLPNSAHPTEFLPPCSKIYLDEAQKYYNSRMGNSFPDFVSRLYEAHGHNDLDITIAMQRPNLIDLNIRELAFKVIEVVSLVNKKDGNKILKTTWLCNVFDNAALAQQYINCGKVKNLGTRTMFTYEGNIFKRYDSKNFRPLFYKDNYTKDFSKKVAKRCNLDIADFKEFNNSHDYSAPDTFYKGRVKK